MIRHWLVATRPRTIPAAASPVLVGTAYAYYEGKFEWLPALLCLLFSLLIQISTNFANDYYDFKKGADTDQRKGPPRAVASGWITPQAMLRATWAVLALAFVAGCLLIPYGDVWLIVIGLSSIACAILYTGGPAPLAYLGLGDIFVVFYFGWVATGFTYFVQADEYSVVAFTLGIALGLLINNLLVVNNLRDVDEDRVANKRTLIVRFGRTFGLVQYQLSVTAACLIALAFGLFYDMVGLFIPAMSYPLGRWLGILVYRAETPKDFGRCLMFTSLYLVLFSVLCVVGLVTTVPSS